MCSARPQTYSGSGMVVGSTSPVGSGVVVGSASPVGSGVAVGAGVGITVHSSLWMCAGRMHVRLPSASKQSPVWMCSARLQ